MTSEEPQLEDGLKEIGEKLLHPSDDVGEVLQLLDRAESLLAKVEQSPQPTMSAALQPVMRALVSKDLFQHAEMDVKVAVASCVSEITRITAPEAPYDDEKMKGVFEMIVDAFKGLDDMSSRSFPKRVSVLETVAKVRLCVVMLDLECDGLILQMFEHFLHTIRDEHSENVFSLMEMIMRVVIEESEEVQSDVIYCLLTSVKKDNKDVLPIARKLGEKVIANNAEKLKPYLLEAIQFKGTTLSDYSGVVASACMGNSITFDKSEKNASGQSSEDDSKQSERTVSEDLAQGSDELDAEGRSSDVGTVEVKSPKSAVGNGNGLALSDVQAEKPDSSKNSDTLKTTPSNKPVKKSKVQKKNSLLVSSDAIDGMLIDGEKEAGKSSRSGKLHGSDIAGLHNGNPSVECVETDKKEDEKKNDDHPTKGSDIETTSVSLPVANESTPDNARPKRGRPPSSKTSLKKTPTDPPASGRRKSIDADEGGTDVKNTGASKKVAASDTDVKLLKSGKKKSEMNNEGGQTSDAHMKNENVKTSAEEVKLIKQVGKKGEKINESESEKKEQMQKGRSRLKKGSDKGETLMEMVSSPNTSRKTKQTHSKDKEKPENKNSEKWIPGSEDSRVWGEELVGCSIKVWWPDDKEFYRGVVSSYDPKDKKHTVFYADGDVEVLLLKDERWRFVDDSSLSDEEAEDKDDTIISSPDPNEGPLKKQKGNTESRQQVGSGKRSLNAAKAKGDSAVKSNVSSEAAGSKSKGKSSSVSNRLPETPSSNSRDESSHGSKGSKFKEDMPRVGNESNLETPKNPKKSKDTDFKSSSAKTEKGGVAEKSARKGKISTPKSGGKASINGNATKGISTPSRAEEIDDASAKASGNSRKRGRATKS